MKKHLKLIFFLITFFAFKDMAFAGYTVEMVDNTASNEVIGTYNTYEEDLKIMNNQNSSATKVATIYKDGTPIDSKYAIFKFKPGNVYRLYQLSSSSASYTSTHSNYGTDAALLGYENGRAKIMISGFIGYTDIDNGTVTPISLLGSNIININGSGIRLRDKPSLSGAKVGTVSGNYNFSYTEKTEADGHTWYKINYNGKEVWIAGDSEWTTPVTNNLGTYYTNENNGELKHYYTYYNGAGYPSSKITLGTAPKFMNENTKYYSFDGNYFYTSITKMLEDYRNLSYSNNIIVGDFKNSVNPSNPYYNYYMYLTSHSSTGYTASDLDTIIQNKGLTSETSKMYGLGYAFIDAQNTYGVNALMMFSTAMNESANGTSKIAMDKNNLFGYGAYDSCAYDCAITYNTPKDSVFDFAKKTGTSYDLVTGKYYYGSHYGNKASGKNVMYATDPYWGEKMAANAYRNDKSFGGKDNGANTIGASKISKVWLQVYSKPEKSDSTYLYTIKNPNNYFNIYNISANVIDKVTSEKGTFYKIYTDLPADKNQVYGYISEDDLYVENSQPIITASDKTVKLGSTFDYKENVTAYDNEDGDITDKITYEGNVDTSKNNTYEVTYTVSDKNNFHQSKKVTITVSSEVKKVINAVDQTVKQYTTFDYLKDVQAFIDDEDATTKLTYEKTVDTNQPGVYQVTYELEGITKVVNVTVTKDEDPIINAVDKVIYLNSTFNEKKGVTAYDPEDGDLTDKIIVTKNEVKTNIIGEYEVTYSVKDKYNKEVVKTIIVKVIANQDPTIYAQNKMIYLNSTFNEKEGVTAYDPEDGNITDKIIVTKNEVDTKNEGKYEVTYSVTDNYKQTVTKTITITVVKRTLKETNSEFDLEEIKWNKDSQKYEISGYLTLLNTDNSLSSDITFTLILKNQNTKEEYKINVDRWKENLPFDLGIENGNDYRGSWFKGEIDLSNIKQGDYDLYMRSENDTYYSEKLFSNIMNSPIDKRENSSDRGYSFYVNLKAKNKAITLSVRDSKLITNKTAPTFRNMINDYDDMSFEGENLVLKGTSYDFGVSYENKENIERKVYLENINTFDLINNNIDTIEKGTYDVISLDNLSKKYAWYNGKINVANLKKGTYTIIVYTKSGDNENYGYVNDMFNDINEAKTTINNKNYELKVNTSKNNRIELIVS